jgi:RimJ/RimL family protein N-acetyltransferase
MAKGLIENAFKDQSVRQILAHTLAEENASCSVLKKCGFIKTGEIEDEEDGLIWRWELNK